MSIQGNKSYADRYLAAHRQWFAKTYPQAFADGFYAPPKAVQVTKANGLTQWIVNFVDWNGYHANRISSAGRYVHGADKWTKGSYIPSTTKKGTADIACIIKGISVMIEVKVGRDRPSSYQLEQQAKVRAAGGVYEFCGTPDEFLKVYDAVVGG